MNPQVPIMFNIDQHVANLNSFIIPFLPYLVPITLKQISDFVLFHLNTDTFKKLSSDSNV